MGRRQLAEAPSFMEDDEPIEPTAEAETAEPVEPDPPAPDPEPPAPQPEEPTAPQAPEPEPAPQAQPRDVPLAAMLDERDRRRALEQELQQLRAQVSPPQTPDPYEDPEGYAAWRDQQFGQALNQTALNLKLDMSEEMARQGPDKEVVDTARDWALARFQQSPAFYQDVMSQRHPYGFVIEQYKRDQLLSSLDPADLDAFRAWKASGGAPAAAPPIAAAPAAPPITPTLPPRSLASAPSAGGVATQVEEEPFDSVFAKRK